MLGPDVPPGDLADSAAPATSPCRLPDRHDARPSDRLMLAIHEIEARVARRGLRAGRPRALSPRLRPRPGIHVCRRVFGGRGRRRRDPHARGHELGGTPFTPVWDAAPAGRAGGCGHERQLGQPHPPAHPPAHRRRRRHRPLRQRRADRRAPARASRATRSPSASRPVTRRPTASCCGRASRPDPLNGGGLGLEQLPRPLRGWPPTRASAAIVRRGHPRPVPEEVHTVHAEVVRPAAVDHLLVPVRVQALGSAQSAGIRTAPGPRPRHRPAEVRLRRVPELERRGDSPGVPRTSRSSRTSSSSCTSRSTTSTRARAARGTSISSTQGSRGTGPPDPPDANNPHRLFQCNQRGYVKVEVTPESWRSEHRIVDALQEHAPSSTIATFVVEDGQPGAIRVDQ